MRESTKTWIGWGAVLVSLAAAPSCVITEQVYEKDGKRYGVIQGAFRGRWYNYYERGNSFLEGGFHAEAVADFKKAIELRPEDTRRARTYGLNFIDYFPNRELGVALLRSEQYDAALEALKTSLSQVDSGRAEFYLNETQRESLLASGVKDADAPAIQVLRPVRKILKERRLEVAVTASDAHLVRAVRINNDPALIPVAEKRVNAYRTVELVPGKNTLVVEAEDIFGNVAKLDIVVTADQGAPAITVLDIVERTGQRFVVGTAEDDGSVSAVKVQDEVVEVAGVDGNKTFEVPISEDTVQLEAQDSVGNVSKLTLDVKRFLRQAATDDSAPPEIALSSVPEVVYTSQIFIDGSASDKNEVSDITINGQPIDGKAGRTRYFRQLVALDVGTNTLTVAARDSQGAKSEKTFKVERKTPALEKLDARLAVAMAPFIPEGPVKDGTDAVEQNLENAIVEQQRFHLLDRSRIAQLVTEWELEANDLTRDGPDLNRLGEALKSDTTMMGWIRERESSIEVYARLVDTDTGDILIEKDVFHEKKSLRNLRELLFGLGLKLQSSMPLVSGEVARVEAGRIEVAMSDAALLPRGARLLMYRQEEGEWGPQQTILGEARVEEIRGDRVEAVPLGDGADSVPAGVAVITK